MATSNQFLVELVEHDITEGGRERTTLRGALFYRSDPCVLTNLEAWIRRRYISPATMAERAQAGLRRLGLAKFAAMAQPLL